MLVLLGWSASGKDTIQKHLIKEYGMNNVISYTTRPKRDYEQDGVDYHFISEEDFKELDSKGFFAETTSYIMAGNHKVYYGSAVKDLSDDKVTILNPEGFRQLKKCKSLKIMSFLIDCPKEELIKRLKKRGDKEEEYSRRLLADERDFWGVNEEVDYVVKNDGSSDIEKVANTIYRSYKGE